MKQAEMWFSDLPLPLINRMKSHNTEMPIANRENFLNQLEYLDLSGLGLEEVPEFLKDAHRLKFLDLSDNFIGGLVHSSSFPVNLSVLNLTNNEIEQFEFDSSVDSLNYFVLSKNKLTRVPAGLERTKVLIEIMLDHNLIDSISDFTAPLTLNRVDLSNNKIGNLDITVETFGNCNRVNLGYNEFEQIPNVLLESTHLRTLGLIGNNNIQDWTFLSKATAKHINVVL